MDQNFQQKRYKLAQGAAFLSITINVLLFVIKFIVGKQSYSVALVSDAWHTLSDSLSSIVLMVGLFFSNRPPTKKYPFGFGRLENIVGIFIAFILSIVAYDFLRTSYERMIHHEQANFGLSAIIVTIFSIVAKEAMAQYTFYVARKTDNEAVRADAWHHRSDALSSVVVLAGIFLQSYVWWIDNVLGAMIAIILFYVSYDITARSIQKLLGEEIPEQVLEKLKQTIADVYPENVYPHHFHLHTYGKHKELTFHIRLQGHISLDEAHAVANHLENKLKQQYDMEVTVHVDPIPKINDVS
ncbi:MAG: cation diffusion facilitator family transporter [Bacteroidales bacterium]|nr:cation diffusion facilitator family transporter [Bacteroidales bacterium]